VILAIPSAQARRLLPEDCSFSKQLSGVSMLPCFAVMLEFKKHLDLPFDGIFLKDSILAWVARNSSKPGRGETESWVLHSTAEWAMSHLEEPLEQLSEAMVKEFFQTLGLEPVQPRWQQIHRWRYASVQDPLSTGCLWDRGRLIGACGDWCHQSRIEGAILSGMAMAGRVLAV
jgi:predicted NAD/FAD-dependent oxidoreductase